MLKKILYLSYDGMTDPLGQSQVLPYLRGLSAIGHEIHLISCEKPEKFASGKSEIEQICKLSGIQWHPVPYTKSPPILSTVYDLIKVKTKAKEIIKGHPIDIIHCRSYLPAMIGLQLKKNSSSKLLFDMRGFWVDERVEGGLWNLSNPLYKFMYDYLKRVEKKLFNAAEAIISLTHKAIPIIRELQKNTVSPPPIYVIPCCADVKHFDPEKVSESMKATLSNSLGIKEGSFVLTYLGGIGTWYLLDEMMDFFARVLVRFPTAVFLFITQEPEEMVYRSAQEKSIPRSSIIIRKASRKEVPVYLSLSNASLFFIKPSFSKQASSPTKQGELMCMGIQIICNKGIGDTDQILIDSDTGLICESFSDSEYDRVIDSLSMNTTTESKNKIRAAAINYFSLDEGVKSYHDVYEKMNQE